MDSTSLRAFDELSADAGESLWPSSVIIGGTTYTDGVTAIRPRQGSLLGEFSEEPETVTLTIRIRKTTLPTAPAENTFLTWESARWKIRSIGGQKSTEAQWSLVCEPAP